VYRDPPEASGRLGDRVSEREERHCHCPVVREERNFSGEHFWARGYAVSTVGFELEQVRKYIREQELADGTPGQF
jgi:REP element-mobilizing transposase RayT